MKTGCPQRPVAERFWERADVRGADEYWPWIGYTDSKGRGAIKEGGSRSRLLLAARVAWEIAPTFAIGQLQVGRIKRGESWRTCASAPNP